MLRRAIVILTLCLLSLGGTALAGRPVPERGFFDWYANNKENSNTLSFHDQLANWIKANISPQTLLPLSFAIPKDCRDAAYRRIGAADSVSDIIERIIVEEGSSIYDGAVAQIALITLGGRANLDLASVPFEIYWRGRVGELQNIRAGYPVNGFIYDPDNPQAVTSDLDQKGKRGFIFRIIDAHGRYNTRDPLDGKTLFKGFPTWPTVHWEDWKPIAGENAWVVIAAMHLYHKKNYDPYRRTYRRPEDSVELRLSEELARAALLLQAGNGGIRMAPIGTHRDPRDCVNEAEKNGEWWYRQISTENNLSWYAALRMLFRVTGEPRYREAMDRIEEYLRASWNGERQCFTQGMHYVDGTWHPNDEHFALDVQTWGIDVLGPGTIDAWFGEGAAFRLWRTAKRRSGCRNEKGELTGVGFVEEHNRLSVEWTAGAIFAARAVADYYRFSNPDWSREALADAMQMRKGIDSLGRQLSFSQAAYSYSSRRGWIPFGWYSHEPQVMSLTSTGWVLFVDFRLDPFFLLSEQRRLTMSRAGEPD